MRPVVRSVAATVVVAICGIAGPSSAEPASSPERGAAGQDPNRPTYESYVALGDSFTAGPRIPETDVAAGCFRSSRNYPSLLAERLDVDSFTDASCSGARTTDLNRPQRTMFGTVPPQLDTVGRGTDLVTLSIGGNDFSVFGRMLGVCPSLRSSDPTGAPCREHFGSGGRDEIRSSIDKTRKRLDRAVRRIQQRAPDARVVAIGYPRLSPSRGTCPNRLPLADGDYRYAGQIERALNAALRWAARSNGAEYVDMFRPSRGHDICSADPWVNGRTTDPDAQAFHPFPAEMVAVADAVERHLEW